MKTKLNLKTNFLTTAAAIISLGALAASAGEINRSGSYQNSRGWSGTFEQTIDRQLGQYSRVTTAGDGKTATVDQTVTRTGNTATLAGSRIGFDGKTSDWSKTITANGNGTVSVNGQYTRQNGKMVDTSSTLTKTPDGRTAAGTYSSSAGKSGNYSIDVLNADGTRTKTENVTGVDGKTVSRVVTTDKDGNTIDRNVATTGPNGRTETHSVSVPFN